MKKDEQLLQESFVRYIQLRYPNTRFCASLGGIRTSMTQAIKAKKGGYVRGFPDMQIMVAKGGFFGLFIEFKTEKGRVSSYQKQWLDDLNKEGYCAVVCKGINDAIETLDLYMSFKETTRSKDDLKQMCEKKWERKIKR